MDAMRHSVDGVIVDRSNLGDKYHIGWGLEVTYVESIYLFFVNSIGLISIHNMRIFLFVDFSSYSFGFSLTSSFWLLNHADSRRFLFFLSSFAAADMTFVRLYSQLCYQFILPRWHLIWWLRYFLSCFLLLKFFTFNGEKYHELIQVTTHAIRYSAVSFSWWINQTDKFTFFIYL